MIVTHSTLPSSSANARASAYCTVDVARRYMVGNSVLLLSVVALEADSTGKPLVAAARLNAMVHDERTGPIMALNEEANSSTRAPQSLPRCLEYKSISISGYDCRAGRWGRGQNRQNRRTSQSTLVDLLFLLLFVAETYLSECLCGYFKEHVVGHDEAAEEF